MHNHLNKTHTKNFANTSLSLKNLKIFQKPQKLGQKRWNAWLNERKESYKRKKMILRLKIEWGRGLEWEKCVWGGDESKRVERDREKWVRNHANAIYRNPWFSMDREVSRFKFWQIELSRSYREVSTAMSPWWIKKLSSINWAYRNFLNGSRSCQEAIKTNSQKL